MDSNKKPVRKPLPRVVLKKGEAADITALRLKVQANGWPLIQGHGKQCRLTGWNSATSTPTAAEVASWLGPRSGATKFPTTNLLIDRGLLGVDFDIADQGLLDEIWQAARSIAPQLASAPIRGRDDGSPKILAVLRRAGAAFTRHSKKWSIDGATAQIEIFGSGRNIRGRVVRQVGALGPHTINDVGEVTIRYAWRGPSPAEVAFGALPELSEEEAEAILLAFDQMCAERGLEQVFGQQRPAAEYRPKQVFDIEAETVFTDADGCTYTVTELTNIIVSEARRDKRPRVMITGSFTGDTASKGSDRCLCSIGRYGLTIWDSKTNITHHLVDAKPIEDGVIADIMKLIAERSSRGMTT